MIYFIPMNIPTRNNKKLAQVHRAVESHIELAALWEASNIMAVKRLGMSDHGPVHVAIVANMALKMLRNLIDAGVVPSVVEDWEFEKDDAEVIVFLGSTLHDLGNSVHRDLHDDFGVTLAKDLLPDLLSDAYPDRRIRQIMSTETLHAMVAHDVGVAVHTVEGGIVRIADGLDMQKGRARIAFETSSTDIFKISGMAVDKVKVLPATTEKPVRIEILMNDAAGIFQVDHLLKKKIQGSHLEAYVEIIAKMTEGTGNERLIDTYRLE
jgi:uncharacterized protein